MARSSRPEKFCKKGVPGNFAKVIAKRLYQRLFFPVKFEKLLITRFLQNTSSGCFWIPNICFYEAKVLWNNIFFVRVHGISIYIITF